MKTKLLLILVCLGMLVTLPVRAADNSMDALKKRFEERYPKLLKLKQAGTIGETFKGYVDFVSDKNKTDDNDALVKDENADREALYKLIAKKENTTPEKVAERNAQRNFEKAKAGQYLQESDGKWHKKSA